MRIESTTEQKFEALDKIAIGSVQSEILIFLHETRDPKVCEVYRTDSGLFLKQLEHLDTSIYLDGNHYLIPKLRSFGLYCFDDLKTEFSQLLDSGYQHDPTAAGILTEYPAELGVVTFAQTVLSQLQSTVYSQLSSCTPSVPVAGFVRF